MDSIMRRPVLLLLTLALSAAIGCRSSGSDAVEAELRARDEDLRIVRSELERTEAYNQYLQRELHNVQHPGPLPPDGVPAPDCRVKTITLGRQTGGYDADGIPGDEALQVVLEPRDADNHTIKAAGTLQVQALEVLPAGTKKPLSAWQISPDELRKTWKSGLLSTGYFIVLPWKSWPTTTKVRVVAQFLSEDRRLFEADKDVTVRVAPALYRKTAPPEEAAPPLMPPADQEGLPQPRKLEPDKKDETPQEGPSLSEKIPIATTEEEPRPLRGAVELLKPVALTDGP
jgi:hypothetical protein